MGFAFSNFKYSDLQSSYVLANDERRAEFGATWTRNALHSLAKKQETQAAGQLICTKSVLAENQTK